MQQRADFLAEQGLAVRRGRRVILARNLLGTLRNRELAQAAKDIAGETGLSIARWPTGNAWPASTGEASCLPVGVMRCSTTAWGFAGAVEAGDRAAAGKQLAATVRGGGVSWEIGRHRGPFLESR